MSAGLYPVPMARKEPPRYQQIADDLRMRIKSGEFPPGAPFPPDHELEAHYDASGGTIKHAFTVLGETGWAYSHQGKAREARFPGPRPADLAERVTRLEERMTAAERYGMDVARILAESGLGGTEPPEPPAPSAGPLSGIWLSEYTYPSTGRGDITIRYYLVLRQDAGTLTARSVPASASEVAINLAVNGRVATGSWTERTDPAGHYGGSVYHGAIQLLLSDDETRLEGKWAGFGSEGEVNSGPWTLALVDAEFSDEAVARWNRIPE